MGEKQANAKLLISSKLTLDSGYIQEIRLWKVQSSPKYPDGVRYRLVLVDPRVERVLILYDNHWPKGHHVHVSGIERAYAFTSIEQLLRNFFDRVKEFERTIS